MSNLISEDDEFLYLEKYLHGESDSFSPWELDENNKPKYPEYIRVAEHYAFFEIKFTYRIDKATGEVKYLSFE